jgi:hypothetical protein
MENCAWLQKERDNEAGLNKDNVCSSHRETARKKK